MLGATIMTHGDDRGLRIPPKLAPIEAVFVPIVRGDNSAPVEKAHELAKQLRAQGYRVRVDDSDQTPGWKFAEWEMRGVPLRIEIGPRDLENGSATLVRRDKEKGEAGAKVSVSFDALGRTLRELLDEVHASLFAQAKAFLQSHTIATRDRDEFLRLCRDRAGMIDIPWCGRVECEAEVKAATGATTRNTRALQQDGAKCVACGDPATVNAYFAQSY
jgi:prolyl-tRNA synthetase